MLDPRYWINLLQLGREYFPRGHAIEEFVIQVKNLDSTWTSGFPPTETEEKGGPEGKGSPVTPISPVNWLKKTSAACHCSLIAVSIAFRFQPSHCF
jgi:hypothetical protein